jgi:hypothetical protein
LAYRFLQRDFRREKRQHACDPGRDGINCHPRGLVTSGGVADSICNNQQIAKLCAGMMRHRLIFVTDFPAIGLSCDANSDEFWNCYETHDSDSLRSPYYVLLLVLTSLERGEMPLFQRRSEKVLTAI